LQCSAAAGDIREPVLHNATTLAGHPVMLNCMMPVTDVEHSVVWLRPTDGLPLHTSNTHSAADGDGAGTAARFVVIGNASAGQHHLLIRYTVFPDDVGRWTCVSLTDGRLVQRTQLTVLVPPPTLVSCHQLPDLYMILWYHKCSLFCCFNANQKNVGGMVEVGTG